MKPRAFQGTPYGKCSTTGQHQVAIRFDDEMFERITALAKAQNTSFASTVRGLIERAMK